MAEETSAERRQCPTRVDGSHSLIEHLITPKVCLDRQRGRYHKCYLCQFRGLSSVTQLPPLSAVPPMPTLEPVVEEGARAALETSTPPPQPVEIQAG